MGHQFQYVIKLIQQEDVQRKFIKLLEFALKLKKLIISSEAHCNRNK